MTEYVYHAHRTYESRKTDEAYAKDFETAKELARNMVVLDSSPEWVEDGHWTWKLKNYGELNENCYIIKHVLKGKGDKHD